MLERMRTASDFDAFYKKAEDPWGASILGLRDRSLQRLLSPYVAGRAILELGCGEGHHAATLLKDSRRVVGVDISAVAISRAANRGLANAEFVVSDFMSVSFENYDVVTAIECVYYLSRSEQEQFFKKMAREHRGKPFILSAPIIGRNEHNQYYTHQEMLEMFTRHGFAVEKRRNLDIKFEAKIALATRSERGWRALNSEAGASLLTVLPEKYIYQRGYVLIAQ